MYILESMCFVKVYGVTSMLFIYIIHRNPQKDKKFTKYTGLYLFNVGPEIIKKKKRKKRERDDSNH